MELLVVIPRFDNDINYYLFIYIDHGFMNVQHSSKIGYFILYCIDRNFDPPIITSTKMC